MPILFYYFCIYFPTRATNLLRSEAKRQLPADFPIDPHLKPGYLPWSQRLCFCPDGDYFRCFESGRAKVVTDTIKTVTTDGIELTSGEKLDADIIITATGLQMRLFGGMDLSVNGKPVDVQSQYLWHMAMLSSVPNFGNIIGYWYHSWTLGSDISINLFIRVIKHMHEHGYTSVTPQITTADREKGEMLASPLKSTYIKNGIGSMPKCADRGPWRPRANYFVDRWRAERGNLNDGLVFEKVST
jgi:cation diffusion facilitator CzcD-associated flavoprotein CzcO